MTIGRGPVPASALATGPTAAQGTPRTTPVAPRAPARALDNLSARSLEAEQERARLRADARQVEHMRIKLIDAEARLQLEKRARSAAETRAQLAYDQGYRDGVAMMQAQVQTQGLGRASAPLGNMMSSQEFTGMHAQNTVGPEVLSKSGSYSMPQKKKSANVWRRKDVPEQSAAAPAAERTNTKSLSQDPQYEFTGAPQETEMLNGMLDDLLENEQFSKDTAVTLTAQKANSTPRPSSSFGSRIDSAADPRLKSLRERALETTAAYRDKQAAAKWLDENSFLAQAGREGGETGETRGKKRGREEVDCQDGVGGAQEDSEGLSASAANRS